MKKPIILSLIMTLTSFSSQVVFSDIKATHQASQNQKPAAQTLTPQTKNTPAWLGVWIEDIPMSLAKHIAPLLKKNQGVIIRKVSPDSPAQAAGLQEYDVITAYNDQQIYSQQQLISLVRSTTPDTKITLNIIHQGKPVSKEVELKSAPVQTRASNKPYHHPMPRNFQSQRAPAPRYRQPGSMGMLPPPSWLNDPFFRQGFNDPFPPMNAPANPVIPPDNQSGSWSESHFESIEIEATGDDKIHAAVKYQDSDGNKKEFVFEGNQNEIRKQIINQKEMDNNRKKHLLQALDMSSKAPAVPDFNVPEWFNQPFQPPQWFHNRR